MKKTLLFLLIFPFAIISKENNNSNKSLWEKIKNFFGKEKKSKKKKTDNINNNTFRTYLLLASAAGLTTLGAYALLKKDKKITNQKIIQTTNVLPQEELPKNSNEIENSINNQASIFNDITIEKFLESLLHGAFIGALFAGKSPQHIKKQVFTIFGKKSNNVPLLAPKNNLPALPLPQNNTLKLETLQVAEEKTKTITNKLMKQSEVSSNQIKELYQLYEYK